MAKRAKPEEIIAKLREVEVRLSQGQSVAMAAKSIDNFNQRARVITRKPRFVRNDKFACQPSPDQTATPTNTINTGALAGRRDGRYRG